MSEEIIDTEFQLRADWFVRGIQRCCSHDKANERKMSDWRSADKLKSSWLLMRRTPKRSLDWRPIMRRSGVSEDCRYGIVSAISGPCDELHPYTGTRCEEGLYRCPGFPWTNQAPPKVPGPGYGGYGSYDMNANGVFEVGPSSIGSLGIGGRCAPAIGQYRSLKEGQVAAPDEMLAFGDSVISRKWVLNRDYYFSLRLYLQTQSETEARAAEAKRHSGNWNVGLCDGHTESLRPGKLFETSDAMMARWNYDHLANRAYMRP